MKVQELEGVVAGVQSPHPLNNAQILEDLENEFKTSERYTEAQIKKLNRKPFWKCFYIIKACIVNL